MSNLLVMRGDTARSSTGDKMPGGEAEDVISVASLEVSINNHQDHGQPVFYDAVYSRGGWIWRTSHRYREWLALKETLKSQYGTRCLPDEETFPKKEDLVDIIRRLLKSCQVCHYGGGHIDISEDRRKGFEAYFAKILTDNREMWETSDEVRMFFSPGPPTSYSAALARRRREQIKEKQKAKEVVSTRSILTSSVRSTFGSLLESMSSRSLLLDSSVKSNETSERGGTSETGGADLSVSQRDLGLF